MKKAAVAVALLCAGCGLLPATNGNGQPTTDNRTPEAFTQVVNNTAYKMTVSEGTAAVAVTIDSNLQGSVVVTVVEGALVVNSVGNPVPSTPPTLKIVLPELKGATLSGDGSLEVGNLTQPRALALINSGSGALRFTGQALATVAKALGSGPVELSGSANGLDATVQSSGSLNARDFTVNGAAKLSNSGSGSLTATVNGDVSFELSSSGSIDWYGVAHVSGSTVTGTGKVTHH